ncbi:MAG: phytol kinase [Actinomycetota bacterium]|jgi:dolichol kinase|nr:phytol kinase [Actinomycetota bacterium]
MSLAGQAPAVVGAGAFFVGLLAAAEAATRRWTLHAEQSRKLAHVSSGVAAACLPLVMPFPAIVVLALLFVPFMVLSRRIGLFPAVHGVERTTWGEVWFPLGVLLAAALFPHAVPYAFGVLVMGLSDAAASDAGRRWGRRAYQVLGAHKTYVGSAAFLAVTVVLATGALGAGGNLSVASVPAILAVAAALTVVEGLAGGGVDNVLLPVVGAALLTVVVSV